MTVHDEMAPVIIGVGEASAKTLVSDWLSPVNLAAAAAQAAIADAGFAGKIDCLLAIRQFQDSGLPAPFGRYDNVPHAIAQAAGLNPAQLIYGDVGGQSPQKHLHDLAKMLNAGEIQTALICSGEALGTAKRAQKAGKALNWSAPSDREFDDWRGETRILSNYELRHGIVSMPLAYGLVENARRGSRGLSREDYAAQMAALWSAFSTRSHARDHAQFARNWTAAELQSEDHGNYRLNDPYRRWMVAQDAVDLGAAILLTTAGHAAALGVAKERMIYLHGGADITLPLVSEQADLSPVAAMRAVTGAALSRAQTSAAALGPADIYSCFPVAVTSVIDALGAPPRPLADWTLTGGLSFFGGPGNGYSAHAIVAMVEELRRDGSRPALIAANGGVLTKQAIGIYGSLPQPGRWTPDRIAPSQTVAPSAETGRLFEGTAVIRSYVTPNTKAGAGPATLWLEDANGHKALALLSGTDDSDLIGRPVEVSHDDKRNIAVLL